MKENTPNRSTKLVGLFRRIRFAPWLAYGDHNLAGIGSRAISIVGKFLLVFYLARFLSLAELGIYGVFTTTVTLSVYLVGAEYYTYSTRELIAARTDQRPILIRDQAIFHLLAYTLILPALISVFFLDFLPLNLIVSFYLILVMTHLMQEIHRVLIALSHASVAYLISAISNGVWTIPAIVGGLLFPQLRTLNFVLFCWAISASLAAFIGLFLLIRWKLLQLTLDTINWHWIWKGLSICYKFFLASIAYRIIDLSNRYIIQFFSGDSAVGIYTIYGSITKILPDLVFAGLVAVIFPKLVASFERSNIEQYEYHMRRLKKAVITSTIFLTPLFIIGVYLMIPILGKQELYSELPTYFALLISAVIITLSFVPHYVLYAKKDDNKILLATVVGAALSILLNILWIPRYGLFGAACATALSFGTVGLIKVYYARRGRVSYEIAS